MKAVLPGLGHRLAPPRFLLFMVSLLLLLGGLMWLGNPWPEATILGFDGAALIFLASAAPLLRHHEPGDLKRHAAQNDANRVTLLAVSAITLIALLTALTLVLPDAHNAQRKLLIVATLALAWLFSNTVYAMHYAHLYYGGGKTGGLGFSGSAQPDYGDFVYFAFTLGMTFQTSDTKVETPAMRRVVTLHSMVAFWFNLGAVAFAINVLGSD